jgi:hypothetical protein
MKDQQNASSTTRCCAVRALSVSVSMSVSVALTAAAAGCDDPAFGPTELLALTYNVAGLPQGISGSDPERNSPLISPKLNAYDLALLQEDFVYHQLITSAADHPHISDPKVPDEKVLGDGLTTLSVSPFAAFVRTEWRACFGAFDSGSDCGAEKGFTMATHTLENGLEVDVYNFHLDAGGGEEDHAARAEQVEQLIEAIAARSPGRALIAGGDTNLRVSREPSGLHLARLIEGAGLTEVCAALSCPEDDHIDRFFFRAGDDVRVEALSWARDEGFVDDDGADLSDHPAIAVRFRVETP